MIQASSRVSGLPARQPRDEPGPRTRPCSVMIATTLGLAEHQVGALVGIVGVDRHVGGAGGQRGQDRDVERVAARRHPDADAVAAADPARGQPLDALLDVGDQLGVGELDVAVVERGSVGMALGGGVQDVDQRALRRCARRQQVLRGDAVSAVALGSAGSSSLLTSAATLQTTDPRRRTVGAALNIASRIPMDSA